MLKSVFFYMNLLLFFASSTMQAQEDYIAILPHFTTEEISLLSCQFEKMGCCATLLSLRQNIWRIESLADIPYLPFPERITQTIPNIRYCEPNSRLEKTGILPNDGVVEWTLHNTGQSGGTVDADVDAPEAWDISIGGNTVQGDTIVLAVIDENFNLFAGEVDYWVNRNEIANNGADDDWNGYIDDRFGWDAFNNNTIETGDGHGDYVARVMAEIGNNGAGSTGLIWRAKVMAVDVGADPSDLAALIVAYDYILNERIRYDQTNGADGAYVVALNNSITTSGDGAIWNALIDTMGAHGILVTGSTRNSFENIDVVGDLPSELSSPYLISVTASNHNDQMGNTGYGYRSIDLAAPSASGQTSFAAPLAAALVGLIHASACSSFVSAYKNNPAQQALLIKDLILKGTEKKPSFYKRSVSEGRLNAYRTLRLLKNQHCGANLRPVIVTSNLPHQVCVGSSLQLDAQVIGNVTQYNWSIPGAVPASSTAPNPVFTFNSATTYSLTLRVQGANGSDTLVWNNYLTAGNSSTGGQTPNVLLNFDGSGTYTLNNINADGLAWTVMGASNCSNNAIVCPNFASGASNTKDELIVGINLSNVQGSNLLFSHAYGGSQFWQRDALEVSVKVCGGEVPLYIQSGDALETVVNAPTWQAFSPTSCSQWKTDTLSLLEFTGKQVQIVFRNYSNNANNLWLDNIRVNACTPLNPVIVGNGSVCGNNNYAYSVLPVSGSTYMWTVVGGTILSGQNTNQILVHWNNGAVGSVNVVQEAP